MFGWDYSIPTYLQKEESCTFRVGSWSVPVTLSTVLLCMIREPRGIHILVPFESIINFVGNNKTKYIVEYLWYILRSIDTSFRVLYLYRASVIPTSYPWSYPYYTSVVSAVLYYNFHKLLVSPYHIRVYIRTF